MIHECNKVLIHIVDDAYVDMLTNSQLLVDGKGYVCRCGLNHHFMPGNLAGKGRRRHLYGGRRSIARRLCGGGLRNHSGIVKKALNNSTI
jgi:hypothetical protein